MATSVEIISKLLFEAKKRGSSGELRRVLFFLTLYVYNSMCKKKHLLMKIHSHHYHSNHSTITHSLLRYLRIFHFGDCIPQFSPGKRLLKNNYSQSR